MGIIEKHIQEVNDEELTDYEMDSFRATMIAEGDFAMAGVDVPTEELVVSAWQYLIDTDTVWSLQGSFQRMAIHLIGEGICENHPDWRNA